MAMFLVVFILRGPCGCVLGFFFSCFVLFVLSLCLMGIEIISLEAACFALLRSSASDLVYTVCLGLSF